jgi:hypothetical protein
MDTLTPDELNALCAIPEDIYVDLAMAVTQEGGPRSLVARDREVLKRWVARQEAPDAQQP